MTGSALELSMQRLPDLVAQSGDLNGNCRRSILAMGQPVRRASQSQLWHASAAHDDA